MRACGDNVYFNACRMWQDAYKKTYKQSDNADTKRKPGQAETEKQQLKHKERGEIYQYKKHGDAWKDTVSKIKPKIASLI